MANLRVIAPIKPAGDFEVVNAADVQAGEKRLDVVLTEAAAEVAKKANKADVDTGLAKKPNKTDVDAELSKKANKTDVDAELEIVKTNVQKNTTDVLAAKDDIKKNTEDIAAANENIANNKANLQGQIDNLVLNASGDSNLEVVQARVDHNGTVYKTLKARLDANEDDIKKNENDIFDINQIVDQLCGTKEVAITDDSGNKITDESGNELTATCVCVKTDTTLSDDIIPANSKAVGDAFEKFGNRIRDETKFPYSEYKQNNDYYSTNWGIPILNLYGDMTGMSKDDKKSFDYTYECSGGKRTGTCSMKWQGTSSSVYPKKNFTITFADKIQFVSKWGKQKKYCLKANYIDCSHARNIVSARMWGEMVQSREPYTWEDITDEKGVALTDENGTSITYNSNPFKETPNGGAIDGFPIIIALNGDFYGLYTLNIPKDSWMFRMEVFNSKSAIITSESNTMNSSYFNAEATLDGTDYDIEYISDDITSDALKASFNLMVNKCIDCSSDDDYAELKTYIDTGSVIDYMLHALLTTNTDYVKNVIYCTYDNKKFYISAYDMDTTFGNIWQGSGFTTNGALKVSQLRSHKLFSLVLTYEKDKVKERYNNLKTWIASEEHVQDNFLNYESLIPFAVLIEDWRKWKFVPSTSSNNLSQIFNQYRIRIPYVDNEIKNI